MRLGHGEIHPKQFNRPSTSYYYGGGSAQGGHLGSAGSINTGYVYTTPVYNWKTVKIDQIMVWIERSGYQFRVGCYSDNGRWYPNKLLVESAALNPAGDGDKTTVDISPAIVVGGGKPLWVAFQCTTSGISVFRDQKSEAMMGVTGWSDWGGYSYSQAFGAFPNPFPAGQSGVNYKFGLWYRVV